MLRIVLCGALAASLLAGCMQTKSRSIVTGSIEKPPAPMATIEYDVPRTEPLITPENDPFAAE